MFRRYRYLLLALLLFPASAFAVEEGEVIVVSQGFGDSAEAAKKDALMNAVHQAVGAYVESETLIENDALIREKILQASGSIVHRHEVVRPPEKREDGLWTMTIRAAVRGGQVKERLQSLSIGSADLDFKNVVGEKIGKIQNAKDGAELLGRQFEDLLPKLMVARLIDKEGKPSQSPQPVVKLLPDGRLSCTWFVEIYFDKQAFYEKVVPPLDEVLSAIASKSGGPLVSEAEPHSSYKVSITERPIYSTRKWKGSAPAKPSGDQPHVYFFLSTGCSENGSSERFQWYLLEGYQYATLFNVSKYTPLPDTILNVQFLDSESGVVWKDALVPWNEVMRKYGDRISEGTYAPYFCMDFDGPEEVEPVRAFSPRLGEYWRNVGKEISCVHGNSDTVVKQFTADLDPADLERIKQVRFHFSQGAPAKSE